MHWSLTATSSKTTMGHLSLSNRSHISEALHQSQDGFQTECPRGPLQFWPMPDNGKEGAGAGSQSKEIKCSLHFACCGKKNTSSTSSSLDGSSTSASASPPATAASLSSNMSPTSNHSYDSYIYILIHIALQLECIRQLAGLIDSLVQSCSGVCSGCLTRAEKQQGANVI